MVDFFLNHKELLNADLPERFVELVGGGQSPEEAYANYQLEQMRIEMENLKKENAEKARAKSTPGSMKASVGEKTTDAFLDAFEKSFY